MNRLTAARQLRKALQLFVQTLESDEQALEVSSLYDKYEDLVRDRVHVDHAGFRFQYGDDLYKTVQPQHTFDGVYAPGTGTESLYAKVARQDEGGDDAPIEYSGNMELEEGKYYTQNGVVYLCTRSTGIPVFNALADLVNIYVEVVA